MNEINHGGATTSWNIFDVIGEKLAWVMLFVLPVLFIPSINLPFDAGKKYLFIVLLALALITWGVARFRSAHGSVAVDPVLGMFSLVALVSFVSAIVSPAPLSSLVGNGFDGGAFSFVLALVLGAWVVYAYSRNNSFARGLYRWLGYIAIGAVTFQIVRIVLPQVFGVGPFVDATMTLLGKWNDFGIFLGLTSLLSLVALLGTAGRPRFARCVLGFSLVGLIMVNFYAVWVAVGVVALALFVYEISVGSHGKRRLFVPALVVALSALVFIFSGAPDQFVGKQVARFGLPSVFEVRPSWSATSLVAKQTLKTSPLLGVGPNRFVSEWLRSKPAEVHQTIFWRVDFGMGVGYIPTSLVTTGVLGILSWALFLLTLFFSGLKTLYRSGDDLHDVVSLAMIWISALYLWFFAIIYTPDTSLVVLASLLTGLYAARASKVTPRRVFTYSLARNEALGLVGAVFILLFVILVPLGSGVLLSRKAYAMTIFQKGVTRLQAGDYEVGVREVQRALALDTQDTYLRALAEADVARISLLVSGGSADDSAVRDQFRELSNEAITTARKAIELDPTKYSNWLTMGNVYRSLANVRVSGAYEISATAYQNAINLYPSSPEALLNYARLEIANGNTKEARRRIAEALQKKTNFTDAILFLSQIESDAGNIREALERAEQATVLAPDDAGVFFQLGILSYRRDDLRRTITALERSVALLPSYSNARYFLGLSYSRVGRNADALVQFKEIQRLNPDNAEVAQIIENLSSGRSALNGVSGGAPEERIVPPVDE